MVLIQILLPLTDNQGRPFEGHVLTDLQRELARRFGGFTAFTRAPAEGVWAHDGRKTRDDIVVVEIMAETLDEDWWRQLRSRLENDLRQERIVIRSHPVHVL
jgi:hypothetical protein